MPKTLSQHHTPLTFLFVTLLFLGFSAKAQQSWSSNQIPSATLPCADEERQWWEQVRAAGAEAAKAVGLKEAKLKEKRTGSRFVPDDEDKLLSAKDREKMNAAIATTTEKYLSALRQGKEKSYRVPLPNNHPIILQKSPARYTNAAREAKAQGVIILSIDFRPDGKATVVNVVRGLGFGLDEKAVEATRKIIFLPAVKDGAFVNTRSNIEFSFSLY